MTLPRLSKMAGHEIMIEKYAFELVGLGLASIPLLGWYIVHRLIDGIPREFAEQQKQKDEKSNLEKGETVK